MAEGRHGEERHDTVERLDLVQWKLQGKGWERMSPGSPGCEGGAAHTKKTDHVKQYPIVLGCILNHHRDVAEDGGKHTQYMSSPMGKMMTILQILSGFPRHFQ